MSKAHRGTPLKQEEPKSGRGTDPVTGQSGVKLLYEVELDGKKVKVSKMGKATLANIKKREEKNGKKAAAAAAPVVEEKKEPVSEAPAAEESEAPTAEAEPAAAEEASGEAAAEEAGADAPAEDKKDDES